MVNVRSQLFRKAVKKFTFLFIVSFIILFVQTNGLENIQLEQQEDDELNLRFEEIIDERKQEYDKNKSYYEAFRLTVDDTKIVFADTNYLYNNYPYYEDRNTTLFGLYSPTNNEIFVNVGDIEEYYTIINQTENINKQTAITFIHELVHYKEPQIRTRGLFPRYIEDSQDGVSFDQIEENYNTYSDTLEPIYRQDVNFKQILFSNTSIYERDQWESEIIARKISVCYREYQGMYSGLYDSFIFRDDIPYCSETITNQDTIDHNGKVLNNAVTDVLQSYRRTFITQDYEIIRINKSNNEILN